MISLCGSSPATEGVTCGVEGTGGEVEGSPVVLPPPAVDLAGILIELEVLGISQTLYRVRGYVERKGSRVRGR